MSRKTLAKAGTPVGPGAQGAKPAVAGWKSEARMVPPHRVLQIWIPGTGIIISALALIVERYGFPTDSVFWFCLCAIIGGAVSILSVRGIASN